MGHRPAAIPAALLALRSLIGLLRDDRLDPASAQVDAARPRGVRLIAATASGRVRGRPTGPRTLTFSSTAMNRGLSAACPGVSTNASGRQRRSAARWTLLVSPPRERPSAAASSRARRRRRSRRRSAPGPELLGHLPPLAAGTEPPDDALKLFAQVLREGAVPSDRQERLCQFPLIIAQFTSRHLSVLPARRDARVRIRPY